ncbi:MAG: hypothetical protein ACREDJ_08675, partial [Methylocella sp.]
GSTWRSGAHAAAPIFRASVSYITKALRRRQTRRDDHPSWADAPPARSMIAAAHARESKAARG